MKKLISLFLVLLFVMSVVTVSATAQEVEYESQNVMHFDTNTAIHWDEECERVFCHIWDVEGDMFFPWQSKREKCTDEDGDGIWTYNLDDYGIVLEDGKIYGCIFSNEKGQQISSLIFDNTVLGDTAYCDGLYTESPESIKYYHAYWRNQGKELYAFGPQLHITDIGEVFGTYVPKTTTVSDIFSGFIVNYLENTRLYSGKSDQEIIDDIAAKLELTINDVISAISETDDYVQWSWYNSDLDMGEYEPLIGDVDGDANLTILDATNIQQHVASLISLCDKAIEYADTDTDDEITVLDATKIQYVLSKKDIM